MATNFSKVVTYHEELPLIELIDPSITWFFEFTWLMKYLISPNCYRPVTTNCSKMLTHYKGIPPVNSYNSLSMCLREVTWQIKSISPHHSAYCHKAYQDGDIMQWVPTQFAWPLNEVVMWGHVTNLESPQKEGGEQLSGLTFSPTSGGAWPNEGLKFFTLFRSNVYWSTGQPFTVPYPPRKSPPPQKKKKCFSWYNHLIS